MNASILDNLGPRLMCLGFLAGLIFVVCGLGWLAGRILF